MDVNLNLLKYYYEVVKEKNITKAAEKLFITQPAMTRAIKDLESQLNTKLLDRTRKGVVLGGEAGLCWLCWLDWMWRGGWRRWGLGR